ncbi:hypothetical protein BDR04DRAFT_1108850 [Suillus decipiens]|nr:hypothetical protein BDR04DRAFT_1108850 [Suillus decipiens]
MDNWTRVPNLPQDIYESHKLPQPATPPFPSVLTKMIDVRVQMTLTAPATSSPLSAYLEPPPGGNFKCTRGHGLARLSASLGFWWVGFPAHLPSAL